MDLSHRKTILRKIVNGLYIVTAQAEDRPSAAVISFLTQSSIRPPMITMAIRDDSDLQETLLKSGRMAIHFPGKDQQELVAAFFKMKDRTNRTLNGYAYELSDWGNPLLKDVSMIVEAEIVDTLPKGDHHLFVCEVKNAILRREVDVLAVHHTPWHYGG